MEKIKNCRWKKALGLIEESKISDGKIKNGR
jgi:hypothetical protein